MRIIILAIYMALFVVACGGSSTPSTTKESTIEPKEQTKIGVFIDAPVKGLAYTSLPSGKKGTTNEKGEFEYIDGDTVSFNMGSIELGSAAPDKEKTVKVTQLKEAILVAQLLQVLDTDADEDKIDVSDIVIPEVIEKAIEKKLKGTDGNTADNEDSTENNNIISEEQFTAIKLKNPTKLTLQQRTKVVPKEKVIEHVEQQIGKKGLEFSTLELENQFLIESQILNSMDGVIFSFSDASSPVSQIDIKGDDDISVLEDIPWEVDKQGKLAINEGDEKCTVSKLTENELIDVSVSCGSDEKKNEKEDKSFKFLSNFIKPQPLSANSFSGKSFKVSEEATITFRNDGTFNCNGTEICSYEDHPSYKNTVLIIDDSEETKRHTLVLLAEGSITKGKFVFIESMKKNKTTSVEVEVYAVADGTLKNLFDTKNQDTNKGEDKDNSKDNNSNDKKESDENTNNDKENSDNNSDSKDSDEAGTPKPTYTPFKQGMISGKTFYAVGKENDDEDITMFFNADNKGQGSFGIHDSVSSSDATLDYHIDSNGYLILSNVVIGNKDQSDSAIGLIEQSDKTLKLCWGDSVTEITGFCKDNDIKIWYKTKEEAEAAIKERKDNDTDENSDSKDNPNAGILNPTYSPFTEKIVAGKTFYVPGVEKDDNFSISFGANKKGKVWLSLAENTTPPDMIFDYLIDTEGYVVFFNVKEKGVDTDYAPAMGLLVENNHALIVCWSNYSLNDIRDVCENDDKMIMYKTKDAAQAEIRADDEYFDDHSDHVDNPNLGSKNPDFIRFTQEMISGKTIFYVSSNGKGTYQFDPSGTGKIQYAGYHENITSPSATFDWRLDDQGYLIFSNLVVDGGALEGQEEVYGLFMKDTTFLELCVATSTESLENECAVEVWLYNKEDAEELVKY